jgi:hypothetical protein
LCRDWFEFFLIEPLWVECFLDRLQRGEVRARVLLNMHSEHHQPEEIYHRLVRLMAERGAHVIDQPEIALNAFDKAKLHLRLVETGIPVPPTVIVRREQISAFQLSDAQIALLGLPFVIKPAMGYGGAAWCWTRRARRFGALDGGVERCELPATTTHRAGERRRRTNLLPRVLCLRIDLVLLVELFQRPLLAS